MIFSKTFNTLEWKSQKDLRVWETINILRKFWSAARLLEEFMFVIILKLCGYARSTRVEILIMLDVKILEIRWVTVEKNENGNLGDFGHRSCQNLENVNIDQFLSKPHSK